MQKLTEQKRAGQKTDFTIDSEFQPAGDQINAIKELTEGINSNKREQVLLGVTGSGKTFTMANIIENTGRPALIMAHNKTLAAQLYGEMKEFFPNNAVEYFVSYYDYYQPEAYIAKTDTFIEKDSSINDQIDLLRHSATRSLLERKDVIVVASVSCIYGLGSPELYSQMVMHLQQNDQINRQVIINRLVELQYDRNDIAKERGTFSVQGDTIDIFPVHLECKGWRISMFGDEIETIHEFDPIIGNIITELRSCVIYAKNHFVTPKATVHSIIKEVKTELKERIRYFTENNMLVEAQRIEQRTQYDLEILLETGSCKGIENYSRYLTGRAKGSPPPTLFEYLPKNALLFIDESHVTVPQIGGMYNGDRARKMNLINHGFRLPSAADNRPLRFDEWDDMRPQTIYISATPGEKELNKTGGEIVQQIIRPTGLVDPKCIIRPVKTQIDDFIEESQQVIAKGYCILCTTLTKKMAEELTDYLKDINIKSVYLHSDVHTLDRIEIIQDLRKGIYDILVGVNLLREGLDIPECGMVAIFDADKEGFLRSATSIIQTIGRAARNVDSKVILYADKITNSIQKALDETDRRRVIQEAYNKKHNITPKTIKKGLSSALSTMSNVMNKGKRQKIDTDHISAKDLEKNIKKLEKKMKGLASNLEFEAAAEMRNEVTKLKRILLLTSG